MPAPKPDHVLPFQRAMREALKPATGANEPPATSSPLGSTASAAT
jgi:hypothetical protein